MSADPEADRLLARLKTEASRLAQDLGELARTRWQLGRLELVAALKSAKRLAVGLAVALLLALVGLPLVAVALAEMLDGRWGVPRGTWLLGFAAGLLAAAAAIGGVMWRRFRLEFVGFEETLEEFHEDLAWLQERFSRTEPPEEDTAQGG